MNGDPGTVSTSPDAGLTGPDLAWLAFRPRDTVFVRDGRAFDAATDLTAVTVPPWPSTIAGATFASYRHEPDTVCGPLLGRQDPGGNWTTHFPVPLDLVAESDTAEPYAFRLQQTHISGHTDLHDDLQTTTRQWLVAPPGAVGKVEPVSGWLSSQHLADYLAGTLPPPDGVRVRDLDGQDPLRRELRVGLAREDGTRRVRTGFLYQVAHLRLDDGWAFLAGCSLPPGWAHVPGSPVQLGGRTRLAEVEPAVGAGWPARPERFPDGRVLVYVATPAIWPTGWSIPLPPDASLVASLVACATGDPQPVATTSPRDGWKDNRALRWAVPPGSVYLLDFVDERRAAQWAGEVHGTAYGLEKNNRLRTAGFGVVLTGVWT